jgi:hypothetical protein
MKAAAERYGRRPAPAFGARAGARLAPGPRSVVAREPDDGVALRGREGGGPGFRVDADAAEYDSP